MKKALSTTVDHATAAMKTAISLALRALALVKHAPEYGSIGTEKSMRRTQISRALSPRLHGAEPVGNAWKQNACAHSHLGTRGMLGTLARHAICLALYVSLLGRTKLLSVG